MPPHGCPGVCKPQLRSATPFRGAPTLQLSPLQLSPLQLSSSLPLDSSNVASLRLTHSGRQYLLILLTVARLQFTIGAFGVLDEPGHDVERRVGVGTRVAAVGLQLVGVDAIA